MAENHYELYCEPCGKRHIIKEKKDIDCLKEVPRADIPGGVPFKNKKNEIEAKKCIPQRKMFKCPSCGRGVVVKKYSIMQGDSNENKSDGREDGSFGFPFSRESSGEFNSGYPEIFREPRL